jgi:hypothetical protein
MKKDADCCDSDDESNSDDERDNDEETTEEQKEQRCKEVLAEFGMKTLCHGTTV